MNEPSHLSRQLGLLFAVAVLALASRWLQSGPDAADPPSAGDADFIRGEPPLRMAEASVPPPAPAPAAAPPPSPADMPAGRAVRLGAPLPGEPVPQASARPISAALCHALDERMRALERQAAGKLPKFEQRKLRAERQRAREMLHGLRCRAGGDRYWF